MIVKYNIFSYLVGEGFRNTLKNKKSTFAALSIMIATMIIFGIFFAIIENIDGFLTELEHSQAIQVFMDIDISEDRVREIGQEIEALDGVNNTQFVDEQDAINIMKDYFQNNEELLDGAEDIFPLSYIVNFSDLSKSEQVQEEIMKMDGIDTIQNKNETTNTLLSLGNSIRIVSLIILVFLIIVSLFIISNTIKLTVHARRKEISIMKYVGATNSFIRFPFVVEGIIIGVVAAAISLLVIGLLYNWIATQLMASVLIQKLGIILVNFADMFNLLVGVYAVLGIGMGVIGSMISMKKYLEV